MENLKKIPDYENYLIDQNGSIYNSKTSNWMNIFKNSKGYECVTLSKNGRIKLHLVHKLIAQANYPDRDIKRVSFKDKDRTNVHIDNLKIEFDERS